jgi:hypothetical protein
MKSEFKAVVLREVFKRSVSGALLPTIGVKNISHKIHKTFRG